MYIFTFNYCHEHETVIFLREMRIITTMIKTIRRNTINLKQTHCTDHFIYIYVGGNQISVVRFPVLIC